MIAKPQGKSHNQKQLCLRNSIICLLHLFVTLPFLEKIAENRNDALEELQRHAVKESSELPDIY